jgi:hypothetical protein
MNTKPRVQAASVWTRKRNPTLRVAVIRPTTRTCTGWAEPSEARNIMKVKKSTVAAAARPQCAQVERAKVAPITR